MVDKMTDKILENSLVRRAVEVSVPYAVEKGVTLVTGNEDLGKLSKVAAKTFSGFTVRTVTSLAVVATLYTVAPVVVAGMLAYEGAKYVAKKLE